MWELDCEDSWAPKNWCFWTVVLEKTLESPLDCKEIQPVHLKEISPGCSLEGLMLKLKLQYFGHLMWSVDSLEKSLMLGGVGIRKRRGRQRMRWLNGIIDSMDMSLSELWELMIDKEAGVLRFMGLQRVGHDWATELNWTELRTGKSNLSNHSRAGFWRELLTGKGQEGTIRDGNALYLDFGGAYIPHCQTPYTISLKFMYFIYWKLNINNTNISLRIATYKINK